MDVYKKNILRIISDVGTTPSALEKRLGFSNAYLKRISDESIPYSRLKMIADALGVPLSYITKDNVVDDNLSISLEDLRIVNDRRLMSYAKDLQKMSPAKRDYIYKLIEMFK